MPVAVVESEKGSDSTWLGTAKSLGEKGVPVVRLTPRDWYGSKYCRARACAGFPEGNFFHILSLRIRNIIEAISSIIAFNVPQRKLVAVFIET